MGFGWLVGSSQSDLRRVLCFAAVRRRRRMAQPSWSGVEVWRTSRRVRAGVLVIGAGARTRSRASPSPSHWGPGSGHPHVSCRLLILLGSDVTRAVVEYCMHGWIRFFRICTDDLVAVLPAAVFCRQSISNGWPGPGHQ